MRGLAGRSNAPVSTESHDPAGRAQLAPCTRPPALAERDTPDGPPEWHRDRRAHTPQRAARRTGVRDGAANRELVDAGEDREPRTRCSCSRNRSDLGLSDPRVAAVSMRRGVQQHVGVVRVRAPVGAAHEVIYTSESLRAAGFHHDNRQGVPAQRLHCLSTHDRGVRVADDLSRFRLKRRPPATGNQAGADGEHQEADNALHSTVIRPRRRECHIATMAADHPMWTIRGRADFVFVWKRLTNRIVPATGGGLHT